HTHQRAGFDRAIEHAGLDLADRDPELAERLTDLLGLRAPRFIELALLGDILGIERIGVGLVLVSGAMTEDDHVPALAHGIDPLRLRLRALLRRRYEPDRCRNGCHGNTGKMLHHVSPPSSNMPPQRRPGARPQRDSSVDLLIPEDNLGLFDEGAVMPSAAELIRLLDLKPHPEGGHFRETFRDPRQVDGARAASTVAYFLLARGERSHWHKVDAVEAWLYHAGAPLKLEIAADAKGPVECVTLGADLAAGDRAGARLASGAKFGRVDAGELHRRARIRFQRFRACAEGLGAVGGVLRAKIPTAMVPKSSCAGLTRASIFFAKKFYEDRWIAGSSPAMTADGSVPLAAGLIHFHFQPCVQARYRPPFADSVSPVLKPESP